MMKVLRVYDENARPEVIFRLTRNPGVQKLLEMANQEFHLGKWCMFDDGTEDKPKIILNMQEKETGVIYGTNSASFISGFEELMTYASETGMEVSKIFVYCSKSRNNRDFLQCQLPEDEEIGDNDDVYIG